MRYSMISQYKMKPQITFLPLLLVFLLNTAKAQSDCCEDYCYSRDRDKPQATRYGTKTPYQVAKGASTNNNYYVPNCKPQKIWLLSRHGTRLPTAKEIPRMIELQNLRDEIIENYDMRRTKPDKGALCDSDLAGFRNWQFDKNITEQYDQFLTPQGWEDLHFMGIHYKRIYPKIFTDDYDKQRFLFRYTNTERCESSFKAFSEGIFGPNAYKNIILPPPPINDSLLKPYDLCPAWETQSNAAKNDDSEYQKFIRSKIFQTMASEVSQRLGFKFTLGPKQLDTIWDMCRYEVAWHLDKYSTWCAAFTQEHVEILEYLEDIKYYYKQGYGSELNSNVACNMVQDMLQNMGSNNDPKVVAYFAHSSSVQLFLTSLGIAKDLISVRADNFHEMRFRQWRTSKIGPFAANIAAVKYDCPSDKEPQKIMFFLNEKPLNFEWCRVGLCDYTKVLEHFRRFQHADCNTLFCESSGVARLSNLTVWVSIITGILALKALNKFLIS